MRDHNLDAVIGSTVAISGLVIGLVAGAVPPSHWTEWMISYLLTLLGLVIVWLICQRFFGPRHVRAALVRAELSSAPRMLRIAAIGIGIGVLSIAFTLVAVLILAPCLLSRSPCASPVRCLASSESRFPHWRSCV